MLIGIVDHKIAVFDTGKNLLLVEDSVKFFNFSISDVQGYACGKNLVVSVVVLMMFFLAACDSSDSGTSETESEEYRSTQTTELWEPLNYLNTDAWHTANWANGGFFYCGWNPDNVTFSDGIMALTLNNTSCQGLPYSGGEFRSNNTFSYGYFETNMKAVSQSGTVTSFLLYTDDPWDEIDVEILGKNTWQVQFNYFVDGVGEHEAVIDLGFDASQGEVDPIVKTVLFFFKFDYAAS